MCINSYPDYIHSVEIHSFIKKIHQVPTACQTLPQVIGTEQGIKYALLSCNLQYACNLQSYSLDGRDFVFLHICMCVSLHTYIYTCLHTYMCIYMCVCLVMHADMKNKGTQKFIGVLFQLVRKCLPDSIILQHRYILKERAKGNI